MTEAFRFASDENLDHRLVRGIVRIGPEVDLVRIVDVELSATPDREILEWAASEDRIVLTHDVRTMPNFAWQRVAEGLPMPGIIALHDLAPLGHKLEDLRLLIGSSAPEEYRNRVCYLPFPRP